MALALNDRVQQTGTANTTVSFTLSGSVTGFQSFAVVGDGNTTYYGAFDASGNWEAGIGTYATAGPTLTRTTILSSSNAGSAVTFSGAVNVFVTYPSSKSVNLDASGNVSALGTVSSGTWQGGTIQSGYGGTGLTTFTGANNALYSTSSSALAAGTLPVAAGGTGSTTLTANNVLLGNGASALQVVAPGTTGNVLTSDGTTWTSATPSGGAVTAISQLDSNVTVSDTFTVMTTAGIFPSPATFSGYITGTTLTVVTVATGSGNIGPGMILENNPGVNGGPVFITAYGTGTGDVGTYTVNQTFDASYTGNKFMFGYTHTLNVTGSVTGTLSVGQYVTSVTTTGGVPIFPNIQIIALGSGTGGIGSYYLWTNTAGTVTQTYTTMYAGGSITTTVDGTEFNKVAGGNQLVRNTQIYLDTQGSILSRRMIGVSANRTQYSTTQPLYYMLNSSANYITSASLVNGSKMASIVNVAANYAQPLAFGSNYGVAPVGIAFVSGTVSDVTRAFSGTGPIFADTTNAMVMGYVNNGPKIAVQNKRLNNETTPNIIELTADHIQLGNQNQSTAWGMMKPVTYTAATFGIPDTVSNAIVNYAGTATVTLSGDAGAGGLDGGSYFRGSVSNAGITAAGTVLTVTSGTFGNLYIGCRIINGFGGSGSSVSGYTTTITALGTGTGTTGTYTIANSAFITDTSTFTAPSATPGQLLYIKTITSNTVVSSKSDVIPITGGSPGTAILAATAGKWALLQYNGTYWEILQAN